MNIKNFWTAKNKQQWLSLHNKQIIPIVDELVKGTGLPFAYCLFAIIEIAKEGVLNEQDKDEVARLAIKIKTAPNLAKFFQE